MSARDAEVVHIEARDGVRLCADVLNGGATPTLLLLPAGAELRSVWRPVVERLSAELAASWRIVAADHRGHGDSGRCERYGFAQFLDDLRSWIDWLGKRPLVVAGGSIGGALGLVAAGEGSPIDGLVLLDVPTVPILERVLQEGARIARAVGGEHPVLRGVDPAFIGSGFIQDCFTDIDRWRRAACRLTIPTLLIAGGRGVLGPEQRAQFRQHVPHGQLETLQAGHLVARDDPGGVAGLLEQFLASYRAHGA